MLPLVMTFGIRDRSAVVLGTAVEQGAGDLGGGAAGLGRTVVELGDLEIAVAVDARVADRVPTCVNCPVVVQDGPDPLVVAEDQPGQTRGRVDHRGDAVVVRPGHVERDPRDAGAVVGEAGVVVDLQTSSWTGTELSGSRMKFRYEVVSSKPKGVIRNGVMRLVSIVAGPTLARLRAPPSLAL